MTIESQLWGLWFESAGSGSSANGQGTFSSLHSPSERTESHWSPGCLLTNSLFSLVAKQNKSNHTSIKFPLDPGKNVLGFWTIPDIKGCTLMVNIIPKGGGGGSEALSPLFPLSLSPPEVRTLVCYCC